MSSARIATGVVICILFLGVLMYLRISGGSGDERSTVGIISEETSNKISGEFAEIDCLKKGSKFCITQREMTKDSKCVQKFRPDGTDCGHLHKKDFCVISCACQKGKEKLELRKCNIGNPCTTDKCDQWFYTGSSFFGKCIYKPMDEGTPCGPAYVKKEGECRQGLCVMPNGSIYLRRQFSKAKKVIKAEAGKK